MSNIGSTQNYIQTEEATYKTSVSSGIVYRIGGAINWLNDMIASHASSLATFQTRIDGLRIYTTRFLNSGTWSHPTMSSGYGGVYVLGCGGGGGGAGAHYWLGSDSYVRSSGGGGGAGAPIFGEFIPDMNFSGPITITIGQGGLGGSAHNDGSDGQSTVVSCATNYGTKTITMFGGRGGKKPNTTSLSVGIGGQSISHGMPAAYGGNGGNWDTYGDPTLKVDAQSGEPSFYASGGTTQVSTTHRSCGGGGGAAFAAGGNANYDSTGGYPSNLLSGAGGAGGGTLDTTCWGGGEGAQGLVYIMYVRAAT